MKRAFFILATVLAASCGTAFAQAPKAVTSASAQLAPVTMRPGWAARATIAPAPIVSAPFGCDARAPNVCHFRIFYTRGDRVVILAAGMKEKKVPVIAGGDYCITLNKPPLYKCTRKVINDKYNS